MNSAASSLSVKRRFAETEEEDEEVGSDFLSASSRRRKMDAKHLLEILKQAKSVQCDFDKLHEKCALKQIGIQQKLDKIKLGVYCERAKFLDAISSHASHGNGFWSRVFLNLGKRFIHPLETDVLSYLKEFFLIDNIDDKGSHVFLFHFRENPYFSEALLSRRVIYVVSDSARRFAEEEGEVERVLKRNGDEDLFFERAVNSANSPPRHIGNIGNYALLDIVLTQMQKVLICSKYENTEKKTCQTGREGEGEGGGGDTSERILKKKKGDTSISEKIGPLASICPPKVTWLKNDFFASLEKEAPPSVMEESMNSSISDGNTVSVPHNNHRASVLTNTTFPPSLTHSVGGGGGIPQVHHDHPPTIQQCAGGGNSTNRHATPKITLKPASFFHWLLSTEERADDLGALLRTTLWDKPFPFLMSHQVDEDSSDLVIVED